ncbi:amino acid ABC transporter substrate-binding protein [Synechococcus elongatus IITB3]|uniref:Amino acid ABC transporter substrate-binding protein n=3 Tax=Synechococcus elongatus TaxID=32046 RepID=A0AAN1UTB3_SYNEL|nr:amino acid ABC transporter substrate-binding protein [Synechococcus elongatus]
MPAIASRCLLLLLCFVPLAACRSLGGNEAESNSRLNQVQARGKLLCGVEGRLPGFSFLDAQGNYSGLDVDMCKAIAAALFNDPNAIEYRSLDSVERFPALASGEVDLLSRNTTWTLSRDAKGGNNLEFAPTTFYDGQGLMVRRNSGIRSLSDFQGKAICVETGTTSELNLADTMRELGVKYQEVKFPNSDATYAAYAQGRCEGVTSDRSQLAARRTTLSDADQHQLLDAVISKEPLSPATMNNDSPWFDVVKWVVNATIQAEEFGITQANIDQFKTSKNPEIRRFLGLEGKLGEQLGLSNDFAYRAVKAVGNYGEIYERNVGQQSPLKLNRGLNQLYKNGGLLYSPPFR